jgi:hypothetical protein
MECYIGLVFHTEHAVKVLEYTAQFDPLFSHNKYDYLQYNDILNSSKSFILHC